MQDITEKIEELQSVPFEAEANETVPENMNSEVFESETVEIGENAAFSPAETVMEETVPTVAPITEYAEETAADPMADLRQLIQTELKKEFDNQFTMLGEQLETQFRELCQKADDMRDKDAQLQEKDELFQKVYEDLKKHQSGLDRIILQPFLKSAIKWYERVQELRAFYEAQTPAYGNARNVYCDLLREFRNLGEYILDTLENYDIEIIHPEVGSPFDRTSAEAMETVATDDESLAGTVQKCITAGFRYSDGKIIQYAKVAVYKHHVEEN